MKSSTMKVLKAAHRPRTAAATPNSRRRLLRPRKHRVPASSSREDRTCRVSARKTVKVAGSRVSAK